MPKHSEPQQTPLEGWKEIAAFLQRDESTARRWEREEGLPIHRHEHRTRSSVYAYPSEIVQWRTGRDTDSDGQSGSRLGLRLTWAVAAAALLLALIVFSRSSTFGPVAEAQAPGKGIRTVEVCGNCDWAGSVSPDGRYISETDWNTWNVGLREMETGEFHLVTGTGSNPKAIGGPSNHIFSPDGTQLAFGWHGEDGQTEVRTIAADEREGEPNLVYSSGDFDDILIAGWSPDNDLLVAGKRAGLNESTTVGFVAAEGGELRVVKTIDSGNPNVRLSPDGTWIAYDIPSKDHKPRRDVYLLAADGSTEILVAGQQTNEYVIGFTPGSQAVLFASNLTGTYGLWAANISEGGTTQEPRLIQRDLGPVDPRTITPDGAMYYARAIGGMEIFTAQIDWETGRVLSEPRVLDGPNRGSNKSPIWAPDGRSLLYRSSDGLLLSNTGATTRFFARNWPDGVEREVQAPDIQLSYWSSIRLSPDGTRMMTLTQDMQNRNGIYSVDLASGNADLLMERSSGTRLRAGGWLSDGETWFYHTEDLDRHVYTIYRTDPGATEGREIFSITDRGFGGRIMALKASPAVDLLAFRVLGNQEIWVMPAEGGTARKLFTSPEGGWPPSVTWSPDGKALIAVVASPKLPEQQGLYRIPVDGGPTTRMDLLADRMHSISLHPDSKTIVYRAGQPEVRIWKMENYWSPDSEAQEPE